MTGLTRYVLSLAALVALVIHSGCAPMEAARDGSNRTEQTLPADPTATNGEPHPADKSATPFLPTHSASPSATATSHSTQTGPPTPDVTPREPAPTPEADPTPVATRIGTIERRKVRGALSPLYRNGATSVINLQITKANPADPSFRLRTLFNDGDPSVAARNRSAVDGFRLIEGTSKKLYIPATTGNGICLCTPASNTVYDSYDEITLSVVFASPPATVTTVDVLIPIFGTVSHVPIH